MASVRMSGAGGQAGTGSGASSQAAAVSGAGGQAAAVSGTWLSLERGSCFCLLGPNGAGKTTTIKCLTGVSEGGRGMGCTVGQ